MIYREEDGDFLDMATQHMLAPIFSGLKAEKALSKDDLFIINSTLYKATADIALNATITIGTNASLASTVSEELFQAGRAEPYQSLTSKTDICSSTTTSLSKIYLVKSRKVQTFYIEATNCAVNTWTTLGVLKSEFRPYQSVNFPAMTSENTEARVSIATDGTIQVFNSSSSTSSVVGSLTFIGQ